MIFVLDDSATIDTQYFVAVKQFVADIVVELDVDNGTVRVGLMTYSNYAEPRFNLSRYSTRSDLTTLYMHCPVSTGPMVKSAAARLSSQACSANQTETGPRAGVRSSGRASSTHSGVQFAHENEYQLIKLYG